MYKDQVALLLATIQEALLDERVALKGGTAINLFIENMPRFSVDLDLCYLPICEREQALSEINDVMSTISTTISKKPGVLTQINYTTDRVAKQIFVRKNRTTIKIEINHVLRGHLYETQVLGLCPKAQEEFKTYTEARCLSTDEVYAGKFCAALDRQHPRDLFDVMLYLKNHEITHSLKEAFLIYLISGNRPISELIHPNLVNQQNLYELEFKGMTTIPASYADLEAARMNLIRTLDQVLTKEDREFLISFKEGAPFWDHLSIDFAKELPAILWKQQNIAKMDSKKHRLSVEELKRKLNIHNE